MAVEVAGKLRGRVVVIVGMAFEILFESINNDDRWAQFLEAWFE